MERPHVAGAEALSAHRLTSESEPVDDIREEDVELHEQGVHRQHHPTLPGPRRQEVEVDRHEAERAKENVGIDFKEIQHFNIIEQSPRFEVYSKSSIVSEQQEQRHGHARILGDECAQSHPLHLHPQSIDQHQTCPDIDDVLCDGDGHGEACVLHAHIPSAEGIEREHGWRSPDTDIEIGRSQVKDFGLRMQEEQGPLLDGHLQHKDGDGHHQSHRHGPYSQLGDGCEVAAPQGLRGHTAGTHSEESEYPIQDIEYHRADGDGADIHGATHMPDNGHVDQSEQRHGNIRDDRRQGKPHDLSVYPTHRVILPFCRFRPYPRASARGYCPV